MNARRRGLSLCSSICLCRSPTGRNAPADVLSMADPIGAQLFVAIDEPATNHAVDDLPLEVPSVIDREARVRVHAGAVGDPYPLQVDDGEIGVAADGDPSLGLTAHVAGGVLAQHPGNQIQGHAALVVSLAE